MLKGKLRDAPDYLETWGTYKGVIELYTQENGILLTGACVDIVELYSYLLPSIARAYPDQELYHGKIIIPQYETEKELLKLEIRLFLENNSSLMQRVEAARTA
jgi:hypothetical protein|uniref:Uncharacterized protein n=1 Tax=candidate division WOR-3 bacterium TaxID=2052148 RepID=A0A7V3PS98_UNCW3